MPGSRPKASLYTAAQLAEKLAGVEVRPLDVDLLCRDAAGSIALLLGDEASPLPPPALATSTSALLEALQRSLAAQLASSGMAHGYRAPAARAPKPIFDAPLSTRSQPLHEDAFAGYPHLVVASESGAGIVRRLMAELGGREVIARGGFAAALDALGPISYAELHDSGACAGCRVLDQPTDPRTRSPESLAHAGMYVYGFASSRRGGSWLRIVSPSVPIDRDDLQETTRISLAMTELSLRFEKETFLRPAVIAAAQADRDSTTTTR